MESKRLIETICDLKCSAQDLYDFDLHNAKYDLDNSFEKYFSIARVKRAILMYKKGEIDNRFLVNWANAYNWICMASIWENKTNIYTPRDVLIFEISDTLDALSFFDEEEKRMDIDKYFNTIKMYYEVLKHLEEYEVFYAKEIDDYDERWYSGHFAFVNYDKKLFINAHMDIKMKKDRVEKAKLLSFSAFKEYISKLISIRKFRKISYFLWYDVYD